MNFIAKFKRIPDKILLLVGALFLVLAFISGLRNSGWATFLLPLLLFFLIKIVSNVFNLALNWSSPYDAKCVASFRELLLIVVFLVLSLPVIRFGNYLKLKFILMELPHFQQIVDGLLEKEKAEPSPRTLQVPAPADWAGQRPYWIMLDHEKNDVITVDFLTDAYGFPPRHGGYIYISSDDPTSLKDNIDYKDLYYVRLAPKWYRWSD